MLVLELLQQASGLQGTGEIIRRLLVLTDGSVGGKGPAGTPDAGLRLRLAARQTRPSNSEQNPSHRVARSTWASESWLLAFWLNPHC